MPKLVIVRGLPGSGKSTYAKTHYPAFEHYEADMFFMRNGEYKYNPNLVHVAHKWCFSKVEAALLSGKNVVVSNTFVTAHELAPYLVLVKQSRFPIDVEIISVQSFYGSIHNVPEEKLDKMKSRWQKINGEKEVF